MGEVASFDQVCQILHGYDLAISTRRSAVDEAIVKVYCLRADCDFRIERELVGTRSLLNLFPEAVPHYESHQKDEVYDDA